MKILLLTGMVLFLSCQPENQYNLDWMTGNWVRIDDTDGQQTFEHWEVLQDGNIIGKGFTLEKLDTVFTENMELRKVNGIQSLVVTGVNANPTIFEFIEQNKSSFLSENSENEFPKRIEYKRIEDTLKAIISDEERAFVFTFVNQK